MAQDIFIKIDGIEGESPDSVHQNEIQVLTWRWGASQQSSMHSGSGGGSGKAAVSDFNFEHYVDKATPNLLNYCLSGKHIPKIKFVVRKAGGDPVEYLVISFENAIITSVSTAGSSLDDARAIESVTFSFTKVTQDYVMQNEKGLRSGAVSATCDVKANAHR